MCLTNFTFYFSYSVKGTVAKKIFMLNQNIVHLIDDIFWNMGFKTETQAEKVQYNMLIIYIISIISVMRIMHIILIIFIICRFVWNLVLRITCGRRREH